MRISDSCKAVLACRVSPKQKAEIVTLVRQKVDIEFLFLGEKKI